MPGRAQPRSAENAARTRENDRPALYADDSPGNLYRAAQPLLPGKTKILPYILMILGHFVSCRPVVLACEFENYNEFLMIS